MCWMPFPPHRTESWHSTWPGDEGSRGATVVKSNLGSGFILNLCGIHYPTSPCWDRLIPQVHGSCQTLHTWTLRSARPAAQDQSRSSQPCHRREPEPFPRRLSWVLWGAAWAPVVSESSLGDPHVQPGTRTAKDCETTRKWSKRSETFCVPITR